MRLESLRQPIALVRGDILWSRYVIIVTDETKSNVTLLMTKLASSTDWSRRRLIAYWVITVLIATECLVGGMMGALRLPPFIGIMEHPGYPAYFMTIIGVWYMLAGVALLAPRFPRLKDWAYAGLVFNYTGAAVLLNNAMSLFDGTRNWRSIGPRHGTKQACSGETRTMPLDAQRSISEAATIVEAVEEGRAIFANIRKFLRCVLMVVARRLRPADEAPDALRAHRGVPLLVRAQVDENDSYGGAAS